MTNSQKNDKNPHQKPKIIFFGNGPLADYALETLQNHVEILFHARTTADLTEAAHQKQLHPEAHGVLASFGVIIKPPLLELFEPEGILNIHPSLLPAYRGPSPIESAVLDGATTFSYSIMKLAPAMDSGPIYHQATLQDLPLEKLTIYQHLATAAANWLLENFAQLPNIAPNPQDDQLATYTKKLDKSLSELHPERDTAAQIFRQIIAYQNFPKPKYTFFGKKCIILQAHLVNATEIVCDPSIINSVTSPLMIKCADRNFVAVDTLQPEGKKPMNAKAFMNGYGKRK